MRSPSQQELKEEPLRIFLDESALEELLTEKKNLQARIKEIDELTKEKLKLLMEEMRASGVDVLAIDNNNFVIEVIDGSKYFRTIAFSSLSKKFPELLDKYPELITEVNRKAHIRVSTVKE